MARLNSRHFVYVFKNWMHDSKTLACLSSSQQVWILLKKLGEIWESSSYREKFIQGTDKFVRPTEMFEILSIHVIEILFCLRRVSRFKGPTNLFHVKRCSSFRVFELSRVNCTGWFGSWMKMCSWKCNHHVHSKGSAKK